VDEKTFHTLVEEELYDGYRYTRGSNSGASISNQKFALSLKYLLQQAPQSRQKESHVVVQKIELLAVFPFLLSEIPF